eukprot:2610787-Lingulodinium_polyedra.AAC.1
MDNAHVPDQLRTVGDALLPWRDTARAWAGMLWPQRRGLHPAHAAPTPAPRFAPQIATHAVSAVL